jgi:hypothetical protein
MLGGMIPSSNRRNRIASGPRESRLMPNAATVEHLYAAVVAFSRWFALTRKERG